MDRNRSTEHIREFKRWRVFEVGSNLWKVFTGREWIHPGTHINAMGADAHGKQELATQVLLDSLVVVDDWEQACSSGEVNVPLESGALTRERIHAALGEIVAGTRPGRGSEDEITVFDSTGLAVQDVALARLIYEHARERGVGIEVDFVQE